MGSLDGRVALVTGASRGIGRAIAEAFAKQGAKLALVARDEAKLAEVAQACTTAGSPEVKTYSLDVSNFGGIEGVVKSITSDLGGLDILINNAGVTRDNLLMRTSEEEWDTVLDTNLKAAFGLCKAASRPLMKSKCGRVINMASIIGIIGNTGQANYAASKGGLIAFTKSLAKELASRNVTCNVIAPGMIQTDMTDALPEDVRGAILDQIALKRLGQPEDIANTAVFLASDAAAYITGQVLVVDGGMVI